MSYYTHSLDPIAFEVFGMPFPWYWLVYFLGYFWVQYFVKSLIKKKLISIDPTLFFQYIFYGFLVLIFSGKLFYILFYGFSHYLENPQDIFAIWKGGMSFHGALIGCGIWSYIYARKHKLNFWQLTDPVAMAVPFVLFFGRMANFINGELAGRVTNVAWAVIFPKLYDLEPRHPSQIYEAILEGIVLFSILWIRRKNLSSPGEQTLLFVFGYGLMRFLVEFFRMPDPQIGYLFGFFTIGQLYCVLMMGFSLFLWKRICRSN